MGQSYGAHNVLSLITQTSRFKAAVITGAITHPDLFAAYTEMRSDGSANAAGYYERGQGGMGGTACRALQWQVAHLSLPLAFEAAFND